MKLVEDYEKKQLKEGEIMPFKPGNTVKVHSKIREGEEERIQVFEGVVIALKKCGNRSTFTVRKISYGVGVERVFPACSPLVEKVEVIRTAKVRRAKLYYLREKKGKAARLKEANRPYPTKTAAATEETPQ